MRNQNNQHQYQQAHPNYQQQMQPYQVGVFGQPKPLNQQQYLHPEHSQPLPLMAPSNRSQMTSRTTPYGHDSQSSMQSNQFSNFNGQLGPYNQPQSLSRQQRLQIDEQNVFVQQQNNRLYEHNRAQQREADVLERLRKIDQEKPKYPQLGNARGPVTRHFPINPVDDIAIWADPGKAMSDVNPEGQTSGSSILSMMCKMEQIAACRARETRYKLEADFVENELRGAIALAKTMRNAGNAIPPTWNQVLTPESDIYQYESFCYAEAITFTHTALSNLQTNICFPCEVKVIPCEGRAPGAQFAEHCMGKKNANGCPQMLAQFKGFKDALALAANFVDGSQRFITFSKDVLDKQDQLHQQGHSLDLNCQESRAIYKSTGFPISVPETQMIAVSLYYSHAPAGNLTVAQATPKLVTLLKTVSAQGYHSVCIPSNLFADKISLRELFTALKGAIETIMRDAAHVQTLVRVVLQVVDGDLAQYAIFVADAFNLILPDDCVVGVSRTIKQQLYDGVVAQYPEIPPLRQDDANMMSAIGSANASGGKNIIN